jgi:hypothetical protein
MVGDASAASDDGQPELTTEHQESSVSSAIPGDALQLPVEQDVTIWSVAPILPYVQGLGGYIVPILVAVLVFSIVLQLRAARQLRRAMHEMGLILDIIEDIYAHGMLAQTGGMGASPRTVPNSTTASQADRPMLEFSSVERAVLQALSDQRDVEEGELVKTLTEQGFPGVLIKAVIGEIIRKTRAAGRAWVEARYSQGRYRYQLRAERVANFNQR